MDSAREVKDAGLKIIITEESAIGKDDGGRGHHLPTNFEEISRVKPKIPGLKEASFIQGSRRVMETFKVASLTPF